MNPVCFRLINRLCNLTIYQKIAQRSKHTKNNQKAFVILAHSCVISKAILMFVFVSELL